MNRPPRAKNMSLFLKSIYLRHFRNYDGAHIHFGPKINVILGKNAEGKTNILEAISLISTGRSFRTTHLSEAIQQGNSFFCIEAEIVKDRISHTARLLFDGKSKKLTWNSDEFSSFAPLLGAFPSIISLPSDSELITHSPGIRRKFLNLHLAQSDSLYLHHLSRFWQALKQRNCLLKERRQDSLDCWETEMARSAEYLFEMRSTFLEKLTPFFQRYSENLSSHTESVSLRFQPSYPSLATAYLDLLKQMRLQEFESGHTLKGPHRDNLLFLINGTNADTFASEGQKKTLAISLRLAQWEHEAEKSPFVAIDDIGGMLDSSRQEKLYTSLQTMGQVFLTTPSPLSYAQEAHLLHTHQLHQKKI